MDNNKISHLHIVPPSDESVGKKSNGSAIKHAKKNRASKSLKSVNEKFKFVSAWATDTRLLGVVVVHVEHELKGKHIHRFFYLDYEGDGFHDYLDTKSNNMQEIKEIRNKEFGALACKWRKILKKEAYYLIIERIRYNDANNIRHPAPISLFKEYFNWRASENFSEKDKLTLMQKICKNPKRMSEFELSHYFLMRIFSGDGEGASYLCSDCIRDSVLKSAESFLENELSYNKLSLGSDLYHARSILTNDEHLFEVKSQLTVQDNRVASFKVNAKQEISLWEAYLSIKRPEFISVYEYHCSKKMIIDIFEKKQMPMSQMDDAKGTILFIFHDQNDYLQNEEYRVNDDVMFIVSILKSGELVISSSDSLMTSFGSYLIFAGLSDQGNPKNVKLKNKSKDKPMLESISDFKTHEQIIGLFLDSEFYTFMEFLDFLEETDY